MDFPSGFSHISTQRHQRVGVNQNIVLKVKGNNEDWSTNDGVFMRGHTMHLSQRMRQIFRSWSGQRSTLCCKVSKQVTERGLESDPVFLLSLKSWLLLPFYPSHLLLPLPPPDQAYLTDEGWKWVCPQDKQNRKRNGKKEKGEKGESPCEPFWG